MAGRKPDFRERFVVQRISPAGKPEALHVFVLDKLLCPDAKERADILAAQVAAQLPDGWAAKVISYIPRMG